jgi:ribosome biogenesis GTPase A
MNKALKEVEEKIKIIDVVIEILDARAPFSSINKQLENIIKNKKKLVILSKPDLADPIQTELYLKELGKSFDKIIALDLTKPYATNVISKAVSSLGKDKWAKEKAKGMKPQPIRAMIIGIPNVGKSSLINRLAKRKAAGVQNKPGFTRGEQWIKVSNDFLLLDTPGILPMNYDDQKKAMNLALIGSIRDDILPNHELVSALLEYFKKHYPNALSNRYGIEEIGTAEEVMLQISLIRKILDHKGEPDIRRCESLLLKEFKDGLLGRISLECK